MANTVRRTPVNFDIPDYPDYKFLNITDFAGLYITDNPLTAKANTASDTLNMYVDEQNALTTRPRLEKKYSKTNSNIETLNIYNIQSGFLHHYKENGAIKLEILTVNGTTWSKTPITGTIPTGEKLSVFEHDNTIYILDRNNYYNIIDDVCSGVSDVYIPTVRVGRNKITYGSDGESVIDVEGSSYEQYNILTNEYKESYFWDGTFTPNDIKSSGSDTIENKYVENYQWGARDNILRIFKYLPECDSDGYETWLTLQMFNGEKRVVKQRLKDNDSVNGGVELIPIPTDAPSQYDDIFADCSDDGKYVAVYYMTSELDGGKLYVYRDGNFYTTNDILCDSKNEFFNYKGLKISNDGEYLYAVHNKNTDKNSWSLRRYKFEHELKIYKADTPYFEEDYDFMGFEISNYDNNWYCKVCTIDDANKPVAYCFDSIYYLENISGNPIPTGSYSEENIIFTKFAISPDGDSVLLTTYEPNEARLYTNFITDGFGTDNYVILNGIIEPNSCFYSFSADGSKLYYWSNYSNGWILLDGTHSNIECSWDKLNGIYYYRTYNSTFYSNSNKVYYPYYEISQTDETISMVNRTQFNFDSTEPLLFVTKTLKEQDDIYSEWNEKREKFLESFLTIRYQNNRWFASGNRVYFSENNNPKYIPLYNYSDLGDSNEIITGFNLADDETLITYKNDKIWSIVPATFSDISTYSFTETRNTVGNVGVGSPIVSVLTEMPIHISYDGIFGLNQLKNVQSTARIATLLSENINSKWLKENHTAIENVITLNRLYWTYFILNEIDDNNKPKFSKAYLLDNRTAAWYYWEFPIIIRNAFLKNNKTVFISDVGNIYTLETTDIINKYNSNLTEYYDDDRQIINWKWTTQIMPLGTINYAKKLIDTTFIVSDTESNDEYALNYKFRVFRKLANDTEDVTISNTLNFIQSITTRTSISRFKFLQLELSNVEDDLNNNKIRLVGLALKYILLEGLLL